MPMNLADKTTEEYIINTPREVSLDEREDGLEGLEIIDCDGRAHGLCVMGYASFELPAAPTGSPPTAVRR